MFKKFKRAMMKKRYYQYKDAMDKNSEYRYDRDIKDFMYLYEDLQDMRERAEQLDSEVTALRSKKS